MKELNIIIDESLYDALLVILKKLLESKIKIQLQSSEKNIGFEQAVDYALEKNKELYKRCADAHFNAGAGCNTV